MRKSKLPKLKQLFVEILVLLYRFRYLNRHHLQTLLHYKSRPHFIEILDKLVDENYLRRYYSKTFAGEASVYSLGLMGRRYLKEHRELKNIQDSLLNRIYKERTLTKKFKKHCMFLADIYLFLLEFAKNKNSELSFYTKTDLHGINYFLHPEPDAYFAIKRKKKIKRYFLDICDELPPRMVMRKRIKQYVKYFKSNNWQRNKKADFPEIIIVSTDVSYSNYLNKFIKEHTKEKRAEEMQFFLTTWGEIQHQGIKREVLHPVELT